LFSDIATGYKYMNSAPRKTYLVSILFLVGLLFSKDSMAMLNYCLFSEVRGVVASDGKPVTNATIERTYSWGWNSKKGGDTTKTNDKGEFQFPQINGFALMAWMPHEPLIMQSIRIKANGISYNAWESIKRNYDKNGELDDGKPLVLYCSLQAPERTFEATQYTNATGICELR
jgi:hypothetical protein